MGMVKVDMDFLEDEWTPCSTCKGKRFDEVTLSLYFKGKNIYDVLKMTVEEAATFFEKQPKIAAKLALLLKVGLGYIELGQASPTLLVGKRRGSSWLKSSQDPLQARPFISLMSRRQVFTSTT